MIVSTMDGGSMKCPICDAPAEERHAYNDNTRTIRCVACGTFDISARSLEVMPALDYHHKVQALQYARTNALAGRFPFIHGLG